MGRALAIGNSGLALRLLTVEDPSERVAMNAALDRAEEIFVERLKGLAKNIAAEVSRIF